MYDARSMLQRQAGMMENGGAGYGVYPQVMQGQGAAYAPNPLLDKGFMGALAHKWSRMLEGIPGYTEHQQYIRGVTAILMENQMQHLLSLNEETRAANVGAFQKYIFPVLRRAWPGLVSHELVSIQAITAPVAAIFYLDFLYGSTKGQTIAGTPFPGTQFDRDYSSESVNGEILTTGDGTNFGGAMGNKISLGLNWYPVRKLDLTRGYRLQIKEVTPAGADVQVATDDGNNAFTFDPAGANTDGMIAYESGAIASFRFQNIPALGNKILAYYSYDGEFNSRIPQVQLDVKKAPVEALPRRLKALWSSEAAEDLRAFHGIDAEAEMVAQVSLEIALEIDREVINDLFANSTGTTGSFDRIAPSAINELDHFRSILTVLATVANTIHAKTLRAPANWMVTSPYVSALLTQLTTHGDYRPIWVSGDPQNTGMDMPRPLTQHGQFGIYRTGTLMNRWTVYEDPFFARDMILMGLKGSSFLDAGYVLAPYIGLQVTPLMLDPNDFTYRKGLRTRYAKKLTRSDFYGQVRVNNL